MKEAALITLLVWTIILSAWAFVKIDEIQNVLVYQSGQIQTLEAGVRAAKEAAAEAINAINANCEKKFEDIIEKSGGNECHIEGDQLICGYGIEIK